MDYINPAEVQPLPQISAPPAGSNEIDPAQVQPVDLKAIHPESGLPIYRHLANQEINNTPGLDKGGQFAIAKKWQDMALGPIQTNPGYLQQINENLTTPQRAYEYGTRALEGFAKTGTAPLALAAPQTIGKLNQAIDQSAPQIQSTGNAIAQGVGAAIPMAATGATGASLPQFAAVGGVQAAGRAASEGQPLGGIIRQGVTGAAEGALTGKILGGAQNLAAGVANPLARAATAAGVDIAGNAGLGAVSQAGHNLIEGRPIGEGVGTAAAVGAAQGAVFAPASAMHATVARRAARVNQVLGEDHPASIVDFPGGTDATAMREVVRAATGKEPVWYQSESPRRAFLDPQDNRVYVNAASPREALEEAFHAIFRGELKPQVQSFIAEHPDLVDLAAGNYAARAEAAGEEGLADRVRGSAGARADEGFANAGVAAMTPEAIANIARTNPSAFMRGYERVLGVIDRITGGNRAKGRLIERQASQFLQPLRDNVEVARARLLQESPANAEESMLDRLEPQLAEHAKEEQTTRDMRQFRSSVDADEALLDRLDPQLTQAAREDRYAQPTQAIRPTSDELQVRPGEEPVERPPENVGAEKERQELAAEDQEAARRARALEYSHADLRAMGGKQLRGVAQTLGVTFDAPSTTIPRILDAQQQTRLAGKSSKQLWDSVRALGLRAGTREQNIATLAEAGRRLPTQAGDNLTKTAQSPDRLTKPPENDALVNSTDQATNAAPEPATAVPIETPKIEPEKLSKKTAPDIAPETEPVGGIEGKSTVELRRMARARGINPRLAREDLIKAMAAPATEAPAEPQKRSLGQSDITLSKSPSKPAGPEIGPDQTVRGRTSFEVSAGGDRLIVEQERAGSSKWRVTRKGQTIGEVSRPTSKVLAGGLTRAEAQAEAQRRLSKSAPTAQTPSEPTIRDLPDDEIPFSVGRGEAAKPKTEPPAAEESDETEPEQKVPLVQRAGAVLKRISQGFKNFSPAAAIPRLSEAGVGDTAWAHAAAQDAAPYVVREMIARTLPEQFRDKKVSSELTDILLKNRYLGAYDRAMEAGDTARAKSIANANPLETFDKQVKAYWNDPAGRANIERYNESAHARLNEMYQTVKGADEVEDFRAPRQGRYFDAYVPIMPEVEGAEAAHVEGTDEILPPNNVLNANVKRDRFDRRATYTGASRDTDLESLLTAVVTPRLRELTKLEFYKDLLDKGVAIEPSIDEPKPATIQGKPAVTFAVKWPEYNPQTGKTRIVEKPLYVRADLVRELRGVLNTDLRAEPTAVAKALNALQVMGIADAVVHAKNMGARLLMSQGRGSSLFDAAGPVVGVPRLFKEIWSTWKEFKADSSDLRSELAGMAQEGLLRGKSDHQGVFTRLFKWAGEKTGAEWMKALGNGSILHELDTVARLILKRRYDELVAQGRAPDTVEDRRDFVMRLGNYNQRTMSWLARNMKASGWAPFFTAGANFNRGARELLVGHPGFGGGTRAQQVQARMVQLGGLLSLGLTAVLGNALLTGSPTGRSGTPLGAIDLGGDDSDGSHSTFDLLQLAGLRRGLRGTGAEAVIEGLRQDKDVNTIAGNAVTGVLNSALHPWVGPAPSFLFKAYTGRQLDIRGKMEAQTIPEGGIRQNLENLRAATESQNPLLYSLTRPFFQAAGLDQKPADEEHGFVSGIGSALAKIPAQAAGVRKVQKGKDAAEDLADRLAKAHFGSASMTPEDAGKFELRTSLLSKLRSDPSEGASAIEQAVEEGKLSEREAANLHKKAGMSPLAWNVKSLGASDAAKVYEAATDEEKETIRDAVVNKIAGAKELSAGQQDEMLEGLGIEQPEDLALRRELQQLSAKAKAYRDTRRKAQAGDAAARAKLASVRLSEKDQARLSKLQNISRAIKKAKEQGANPGKIKQLLRAA
jgi:hypothetical protein